eukprot:746706-Hanusia_phi.AAC.4
MRARGAPTLSAPPLHCFRRSSDRRYAAGRSDHTVTGHSDALVLTQSQTHKSLSSTCPCLAVPNSRHLNYYMPRSQFKGRFRRLRRPGHRRVAGAPACQSRARARWPGSLVGVPEPKVGYVLSRFGLL